MSPPESSGPDPPPASFKYTYDDSASCDPLKYLQMISRRLDGESARCQRHHFPSSTTLATVRRKLLKHLLTDHLDRVIHAPRTGLAAIGSLDGIRLLYSLTGADVSEGRDEMAKAFAGLIKQEGRAVNEEARPSKGKVVANDDESAALAKQRSAKGDQPADSPSLAIQWVESVLVMKQRYDEILRTALQGDKRFQMKFNEAFVAFVNENKRAAEFISLFLDENLRKGLKGKTESEVEQTLNQSIALFRFIADKDIFERYYKQHLAKRLLSGRGNTDDAERGMISKLKVECGYQFTARLEGMFNDMRVSEDLMRKFRELHSDTAASLPKPELTVNVLTMTNWPIPTLNGEAVPERSLGRLPMELAAAADKYKAFYTTRYNGRRLTWNLGLGTADVRAQFRKTRHDLVVSTWAALVLCCFNQMASEEAELTFVDILSTTELGKEDLQRTLQSLACGKYRVLTKHPVGREIAETDTFRVNMDFSASLARIRIPQVASSARPGVLENDAELRRTQERVEEARQHQCDAAIVRVMKARGRIRHVELVAEVTRQLATRFQVDAVMVKKRIEVLIDREYMERTAEDRKMYQYIA